MAKIRSTFVCQQCGSVFPAWQGKCAECGAWNSLHEEISDGKKLGMVLSPVALGSEPQPLDKVITDNEERFSSGLSELDKVLGGGLVVGSLVLLGGAPGIGKSTLLLQVAGHLGRIKAPVLYVSGEESPRQIRMRSQRIGCVNDNNSGIFVLSETNVEAIESRALSLKPSLLIVDSIQTVFRSDLTSAPGSVTQVRECAAALMRLAKSSGITIVLVGHVTKEGELAGPRVLEHLVDTVLHFSGHGLHNIRTLRPIKNRFGNTQEMAFFDMSVRGLTPILDASSFFLAQRVMGASGTVVFPSMEGSRPVLVEIQALVAESYLAEQGVPPTRRALGADNNRLGLLLAVLQKRCSVKLALSKADVYVNVAGGLRLTEPAVDLAIVIAVISSRLDIQVDAKTAVFGEVGLSGEVRSVSGLEPRLTELFKNGFTSCVVPKRSVKELANSPYASNFILEKGPYRAKDTEEKKLHVIPVDNLDEAVSVLGLKHRRRTTSQS